MSPATIEALRVAYAAWAVVTTEGESGTETERVERLRVYIDASSAAIALALVDAGVATVDEVTP
jgi:hypothetical protein